MRTLASEPVRTAVYSAAVAVLALLVALGVIDDAASTAIAGGVTALLAAATELARSKVSPVAPVAPGGAHVRGPDETP